MKVAVINNSHKKTIEVVEHLKKLLAERQITIDEHQPDVAISVGGDGALLSAFHRYEKIADSARLIGIHTGHLSFYIGWRDYDINQIVDALCATVLSTSSYPLLELTLVMDDGRQERFLTSNGTSIKRISKTLVVNIYIRGELFGNFRGDGICVFTPTDSTAYSRALGGTVIHPRLKVLQMTEIASINNRVFRATGSPIAIVPDEWITILPNDEHNLILIIDGNRILVGHANRIIYRIPKQRIYFNKPGHHHFWSRVGDAFTG